MESISGGFLYFFMNALSALGLWYGLFLVREGVVSTQTGEVYSGGDIVVVVFNITIGLFITVRFRSNLSCIFDGVKAFRRMVKVIDRNEG